MPREKALRLAAGVYAAGLAIHTADHIRRFRKYSEAIWDAALAHDRTRAEPLDVAFTVNMAQTAYLWAKIAKSFGASPTVYLHPGDTTALSRPEWPSSWTISRPRASSQNRMVQSVPADTRLDPSGLSATSLTAA